MKIIFQSGFAAFIGAAAFLRMTEVGGGAATAPEQGVASTSAGEIAAFQIGAVAAYGQLPLSFEPNQGQSDARVKFLSRGAGYSLFLTEREVVLALAGAARQKPADGKGLERSGPDPKTSDILRFKLLGANAHPRVEGMEPLPGKTNYFIGDNPKKWRTDIAQYGEVRLQEVYPGIDLVYYGNHRQLEYDFRLAPGADPGTIRFAVEGAQKIEIDAKGNLLMHGTGGEVIERAPVIYQEIDGRREAVVGGYELHSPAEGGGRRAESGISEIGFRVASYDRSKPLIIDPALVYSTYLGGSNFGPGKAIAVDSAGNAYVTGYTYAADFPTTSAAYQKTDRGSSHGQAFVTKINPTGTALVYSTYLGGSGSSISGGGYGDGGNGIAVDASGSAYVTGYTNSTNFPTTAGAFQKTNKAAAKIGSPNAFVTKLNPAGSALVYSTYLGGGGITGFGDYGSSVAVDSSGHAYVAGAANSTKFPTTAGAFQTTNKAAGNGAANAFVAKLNPAGSALVYSTYLGGSNGSFANGVAIDASGNAYVTGSVNASNFPITAHAFQKTNKTDGDGFPNAFVTKLNPAGSALVYSTYLGGSSAGNYASAIALDASGDAFVTGFVTASDFPITADAFQKINKDPTSSNAFVTKLNPAGAALIYSTYLGGADGDYGTGIAVDSSGNAYVTGQTGSTNFPLMNPLQRELGGPLEETTNAFLTKLNPAGSALLFSTYFGGNSYDNGAGIALDHSGHAYITGQAGSENFRTTAGAYQKPSGEIGAFVARIDTLVKNDLNGNAKPDLVWQNSSTGQIRASLMNGTTVASQEAFSVPTVPGLNWEIVGTGDFNGDGHPDLVLQNNANGQIEVWYMNGVKVLSTESFSPSNLPDLDWKIVGVGDFNGDGKPDLVWENISTGHVDIWLMNGTKRISQQSLPSVPNVNWLVVAVDDFNGNASPDLVLQNNVTGQIEVWLMAGPKFVASKPFSPDAITPVAWKIVGSGDFDFDGRPDLILQNASTGATQVWFMNGTNFLSSKTLSIPETSAAWKIRNR